MWYTRWAMSVRFWWFLRRLLRRFISWCFFKLWQIVLIRNKFWIFTSELNCHRSNRWHSSKTCQQHHMWHMSPTSSRGKNTNSIISSGFASPIMTLSRSYSALRSAVSVKLIASKYRRAISFTSGLYSSFNPWETPLKLGVPPGSPHYKCYRAFHFQDFGLWTIYDHFLRMNKSLFFHFLNSTKSEPNLVFINWIESCKL